MDYRKFTDLEKYLFENVNKNYHKNKYLNAFDFFCIIIWKANRAKTKIAKKILEIGKNSSLEIIVKMLTSELYKKQFPKDKLKYLIEEWKFRLPISSAILTVFYPDIFTVYDIRVTEIINDFKNLNNLKRFEKIWNKYIKFIEKVDSININNFILRDKDKYLWGKSFFNQLKNDINNNFGI